MRTYWAAGRTDSPETVVADRDECVEALTNLSESDRDLLLLVAWDGLTLEQAGVAPLIGSGRLRLATGRAWPGMECTGGGMHLSRPLGTRHVRVEVGGIQAAPNPSAPRRRRASWRPFSFSA